MHGLTFILVFILLILLVLLFLYSKKRNHEKKLLIEKKIAEIISDTDSFISSKYDYLLYSLLDDNHYFSHSEMLGFVEKNELFLSQLDFINECDAFNRFSEPEKTSHFYRLMQNIESERENHNKKFVEKELTDNSEYFDNILSYPLDKQQRESIVKLEDNCLVISSAGSGKTSTMIGKLRYLVDKRGISPERILTITYTRKAAEELTQRLKGTGLECITFHKLALNIIKHAEAKKPSICTDDLFHKIFYEMLGEDAFKKVVLNYLTDYKSTVKPEHEYTSSIDYYADRKKNGVVAYYADMDGKMIVTKSEQEKYICHYLTELGVQFRYEQSYEFDTYTEDYRQYKPDFTIYYTDAQGNAKKVYLEHFGIDRNGNVPRWFGNNTAGGWHKANETYLEGIEWKKKLHIKHKTTLIYTTSADFYAGTIRKKLKNLLESVGVPVRHIPETELLKRIFSRGKSIENAIMQMAQGFINLTKSNDKTPYDIIREAEKQGNKRDVFVIKQLMIPLWEKYHKELSQRKEVDFTDIINTATKYCLEGKWDKRYEYILIDEFQDISVDRYRFLQSLRTDLPMTKLYCVGDDWQSIYRFSGSDMSLFSQFSKYFGFTEECRIETTYRFGNPLIDISSSFIQRNHLQKKKQIHAVAENPLETKLSFVSYNSDANLQELIRKLVCRVPTDKTIYIISRYSYDVKSLMSASQKVGFDYNQESVTIDYDSRKVRFMTIHGSKGLEADYVFLINCNSGLYGFPSLISDDPILDYVLSEQEHYEYAEERRVFYVGITRAKVHTVVFYNEQRPSTFVTELHKPAIVELDSCPLCGIGHKIIKYTGIAKNKTPYKVWGCDNTEANCQYFERTFENNIRQSRFKFQ